MDTLPKRATTGIPGLDDVLGGGLTPHRLYLIEGMPGSGKTTLAFQFLLEGVRQGERVLYVTLSETEEEIRAVGASHGWPLDQVMIRELVPTEQSLEKSDQYSVFHPSEIELSETTRKILADVDESRPSRIVFDSLSELRLLAGNPLRYRRQILALKQFFAGRRCTVLMLDDLTSAEQDLQVQSIAHGAILLEHTIPHFGTQRRRLSITKFRGSAFRGGYHDYTITRGGLEVFPRLVAAEHRHAASREQIASGIRELDQLLGGGVERGTSTLIVGAAGSGKSSIAALLCASACARGEHATMFIFDESANTLFSRMSGLGMDLKKYVGAGKLAVREVDPAELSPGEFAHEIRRAVEKDKSTIVVVDSLNGYLNSMPDEKFLVVQMHELLTYLGHQGVATVLVAAQHGMISSHMSSPVDASYLADSVLLLRYFEAEGEVRQAISVLKKRGGEHERSIREMRMAGGRITIGEPLRDYRGVFTGVPEKRARP
jgi:circadian clock protein KaiC